MHSGIQAKRLLVTWLRDPSTTIQALVYPAFMLLMFRVVLGNSITAATGQSSIFGTVPLIILVGAMFGSIASAVGLKGERASGLLSRFWTLPAHRASGLVGRMIAEAVRVLVTSIVILGVGYLLGFRFNQGPPLAAVALLVLPIVFGIGFAMMVTALATVADNLPLVEIVSISCTLLMFFNSGFVPVMAYPKWLQPVVAEQPMSVAIDAMKGLSLGGARRRAPAQDIGLVVRDGRGVRVSSDTRIPTRRFGLIVIWVLPGGSVRAVTSTADHPNYK